MFSLLRQTILVFVTLTLLTGVAYPVLVTLVAQVTFPHMANGSLIERDGKLVGSELIGQYFDDPKYFWSRPSATTPPYNGGASSGSNYGPTNPAQLQAVKERVAAIQKAHSGQSRNVPVDLVTASGSGLDPHISPEAADFQVPRIAKARNLSEDRLRQLVGQHVEGRSLGFLGEPRVNVLALNMALDRTAK